jgi:NADP-dependent 3-hydroxy acid dehydrogenase YdfG
MKMNADQFDKVVDVSLTGAFRCALAVLKIMTRQRMGHLIHVGSYAA